MGGAPFPENAPFGPPRPAGSRSSGENQSIAGTVLSTNGAGAGRRIDSVHWDHVRHAYGPATDVPKWIEGLRDPSQAQECQAELYASIVHQGSRYSATPLCIPFLVDAVLDPTTIDRLGVLLLVQFCAIGPLGDHLAWERQRDLQRNADEQASWEAFVSEHPHLRRLFSDPDRSLARVALTVLAWTGDTDELVFEAIASGFDSDDERDGEGSCPRPRSP